jgi:tetratricopeptide (TPR) repeat protein
LKYQKITFIIFFTTILFSCADKPCPVLKRLDKSYGWPGGYFQGDWEDYYICARSYNKGGFYDDAILALDKAIKQRDQDQWRARTYGMHFVDYFPHREKGYSYFQKGLYEKAKIELKKSISQEPSDKGYFYLDQVRKQMMKQKIHTVSKPQILIHGPHEFWTNKDSVILSGIVTDDQFVSKIMIGFLPYYVQSAGKRIHFKKELFLHEGTHQITIFAQNLLNGQAQNQLFVHVDQSGPLIIIEKRTGKSIQGFLFDDSGEISLFVDSKKQAVPDGKHVPFSISIRQQKKTIRLMAQDKIGNQTVAIINPNPIVATKNQLLAFNCKSNILSDQQNKGLLKKKYRDQLEITFSGLNNHQMVFSDKIFIEGQVKSNAIISNVIINDTLIFPKESQPNVSGKYINFCHPVFLKEGENEIVVSARDQFGINLKKKLIINRKIPSVRQLKHRFAIAFYDLENYFSNNDSLTFQNLLLKNLIQKKRFQIILRNNDDKTRLEQNLFLKHNKTSCLDMSPPQAMLKGIIYESDNEIEVVIRLVDIKTTKVLIQCDIFTSDKKNHLNEKVKELSDKFHAAFPLIDGMIRQGNEMLPDTNNLNNIDNVLLNSILILYKKEKMQRNSVTGKPFGAETTISGYAHVNEIVDDGRLIFKIDELKKGCQINTNSRGIMQ